MTLTVEDGTGLTDADSYVELQDVTDYLTKFGDGHLAAWEALVISDENQAEVYCRTVGAWIDVTFERRMKGFKRNGDQSMAYGREAVYGYSGFTIPSEPIPQHLRDASSIMITKLMDGDTLIPDTTPGTTDLTRKKIEVDEIVIDKSWSDGQSTSTKTYDLAELTLSELLHSQLGTQR